VPSSASGVTVAVRSSRCSGERPGDGASWSSVDFRSARMVGGVRGSNQWRDPAVWPGRIRHVLRVARTLRSNRTVALSGRHRSRYPQSRGVPSYGLDVVRTTTPRQRLRANRSAEAGHSLRRPEHTVFCQSPPVHRRVDRGSRSSTCIYMGATIADLMRTRRYWRQFRRNMNTLN
jgi:hypothetical protein